ncbi:YczE/YyaS/YitT family protein [Paenibacillus kobensis]|uniref:YczE/YyaS/YitT family protein n=1 Tax=Paenibacillus kobensis TaxID=59841 RepID=UPI001FEB4DB5|nr:permease [Paenibacillus kobensis]
MIKANIGVAPWDALNVALTDKVGLTVGSWVFIVGGVIILINGIIRMRLPNVTGAIPIVIIGFFVDLLNLKVLTFLKVNGALHQWILFLAGLSILAAGISFYLRAQLPSVPNDELMLAVTERTGWQIYMTKTIGEAAALILAIILKGPVGVGTIIVMLGIGVLIHVFDKLLHKIGFSSPVAQTAVNEEK